MNETSCHDHGNCDLCDRIESELAAAKSALYASCAISDGRAYFRTLNGVLMEMPRKSERIVRPILLKYERSATHQAEE